VTETERCIDETRRCATHAVKSALPVTARVVSSEILEDHTAPLWPGLTSVFAPTRTPMLPDDTTMLGMWYSPRNVPIQSPSQLRSIGFPSLHADMRRYVPSSSLGCVSTATGRTCAPSTRTDRTTAEIAPTPATLCMKPLCDLSTHKFENWRWTTGRVCPEHNNGCTFALFPTGPAPLPFNPPLPFMPAGSGVRGREKPLV
jgi:hypothetical protein